MPYNTAEEVQAFCAARGLTLPTGDALEAAMQLATDFIEAQRDKYQGAKKDAAQPLQFPRVRVRIDGFPVADNEIPQCVKYAHCRATYEVTQGLDLQPIIAGHTKITDTVGPLTDEFSEANNTADGQDVVQSIYAFLVPVFRKDAINKPQAFKF